MSAALLRDWGRLVAEHWNRSDLLADLRSRRLLLDRGRVDLRRIYLGINVGHGRIYSRATEIDDVDFVALGRERSAIAGFLAVGDAAGEVYDERAQVEAPLLGLEDHAERLSKIGEFLAEAWAGVVGRYFCEDTHQRKLFGAVEGGGALLKVFGARKEQSGECCGGNGAAAGREEPERFGGVVLQRELLTVYIDRDGHLFCGTYPSSGSSLIRVL